MISSFVLLLDLEQIRPDERDLNTLHQNVGRWAVVKRRLPAQNLSLFERWQFSEIAAKEMIPLSDTGAKGSRLWLLQNVLWRAFLRWVGRLPGREGSSRMLEGIFVDGRLFCRHPIRLSLWAFFRASNAS